MNQNDQAFSAVLKREVPALAGFILAVLGDRYAAEDLLQSTCLELWRIRGRFRPGSNFGAWARSVARIQIKRYWRKRGREKVKFETEALDRIEAAYAAPEENSLQELRVALEACLEELSEDNRQLLKARYNHSTPVRVLAEKRGRTESALKVILFRLRRWLKRCIEAHPAGKDFPDV